jgi:CubicO group peptidase (beta-lactamase class C family)
MVTQIEGSVSEGFEDIVDVYGRLAAAHAGHASELSVRQHGELVVELRVGGYPARGRQLLFSVSKLVVAIALQRAADDGLIDVDAPLARHWSAFDRAGTRTITLRDVLAHRSGLFRLEQPIDLADLLTGGDKEALESQDRDVRFGHAYHAFTFGTLVSGALESAGAPTPAQLIQGYLAAPLGLDLHLGLGDLDAAEVVPIVFDPPASIRDDVRSQDELPIDQALVALLADPQVFNSGAFFAAESAAMGVIGTADALSSLMAAVIGDMGANGLFTAETRGRICEPLSQGRDGALGVTTRFGSGVQLSFPRAPWTSRHAFGHEGAGGSAAFADPELGLAVGFTTSRFPSSPGASPVLAGLFSTLRERADSRL